MARWTVWGAALLLAAGCNVTVEGAIVDGITGEPIAGKPADAGDDVEAMRIVAQAMNEDDKGVLTQNIDASLPCMTFAADVGSDGKFSIPGVCASSSLYSLELNDPNLFLAEQDTIPMGFDGAAPVTIKAWRAPKGGGVFKLGADGLSRVTSATDLNFDFVYKSEQQVRSPKTIKSVPLVAAGEHLVLAGSATNFAIEPIINSDKRRLGKAANESKEYVDQVPWAYLGIEFSSDTDFELKTVTVDDSKVISKEKRGRTARFLAADSLPAGRYAIVKDGGKRIWIVDMGQAGEDPKPAEEK